MGTIVTALFGCSWVSAVTFAYVRNWYPFPVIKYIIRKCIVSLFFKHMYNIRLPIFLTGNNNFNSFPVAIVGPAAINWGTFRHLFMCFWFRAYSDSPTNFLGSTSGYSNNRNRHLKTEQCFRDKILFFFILYMCTRMYQIMKNATLYTISTVIVCAIKLWFDKKRYHKSTCQFKSIFPLVKG